MTHGESLPAQRQRPGKISPLGKMALIVIGINAFGVFTACFCLDLFLCGIGNSGCTVSYLLWFPPRAPARDFETSDLLLDEDALPPGWIAHGIDGRGGSLGSDGEIEDVWQHYTKYDDNGEVITAAFNNIMRYEITDTPYKGLSETYIFNEDGWEAPPAEFESRYADRWRLACNVNIHLDVYECVYFAEYVEFLVKLKITMAHADTPDMLWITYDEAISIFKAMDDRMAQFLGLG